jgi:hypothetical protein
MAHATTFDAFQHSNVHDDTHSKKIRRPNKEVKMSNNQIFDTLQYANKLKAVGVPEKQAEVQAEAMVELIEDKLATKKDLEQAKSELKKDIEQVKSELKLDIEVSKNELKRDIKELELRMTIKLGSLMIAGMGVLVILMKLFKL